MNKEENINPGMLANVELNEKTSKKVIAQLVVKNANMQRRINKAIDKLYCWGEVLDAQFQQEMLNILRGEDNE